MNGNAPPFVYPVRAGIPALTGAGHVKNESELCILLVEDDDDSRQLLQRLLMKQGYTVHAGQDYASALDIAAHQRVDLLISDIGLPDRDGCEVMKAIKRMYAVRGIALTGFDSDEDATRYKAAGFTGFITKPCDLANLLEVVATVVRN